ncbi:MAG: hypothetical protein HY856_13385 [Burkholderiales bacterium]|nr:hypothetical protein [Burkholderiales bacterium]
MTDQEFVARVKRMGCRLCKRLGHRAEGPSDAHHIRVGVGGAERQHDYLAIPLCKEHHQGKTGIHGSDRGLWRLLKVDELDLLADTIKELSGR